MFPIVSALERFLCTYRSIELYDPLSWKQYLLYSQKKQVYHDLSKVVGVLK